MFKTILITMALIVAGMLGLHHVLQDGSLLRYLDEHPDPRWVPATEYTIGQGYLLMQDLTEAATYFIRVHERYPASTLSDSALFAYIDTRDNVSGVGRGELVELYQTYLE